MKSFELTYKPFGKSALLIEWPAKMSPEILENILAFNQKIKTADKKYIIEIIQSINSVTVIYQSELISFNKVQSEMDQLYKSESRSVNKNIFRKWKIPVCYDISFGLDLKEMALDKELSISEIIGLHANRSYKIYAIGFLPGFLYLGGLSEELYIPRKSEPRLDITKGAVGIGGTQTGVYPNNSPGGWHIIGNTPISFFDVARESPCFANPGDEIEFVPITKKEHAIIQKQINSGTYKLESEVINA